MMVLGYCINVCTPELGWSQALSASQMPNPQVPLNNLLHLLQGKCMVPTCSAGVQGWGACSREVHCIQLGACKPRSSPQAAAKRGSTQVGTSFCP
jgi:hypothetical protein